MISEILFTIFPTLIVAVLLSVVAKIVTDIKVGNMVKALALGILLVIPAIFTMKAVGVVLTITVPLVLPVLFYTLISALNEELYKYWAIRFRAGKHGYITAILVGAGFSLSETLYLSLGNPQLALYRSYTALPLHIITSLLLAKSRYQKRYFLLALLLHISFNLIQ